MKPLIASLSVVLLTATALGADTKAAAPAAPVASPSAAPGATATEPASQLYSAFYRELAAPLELSVARSASTALKRDVAISEVKAKIGEKGLATSQMITRSVLQNTFKANFTNDELKTLATFFSSPLGQKWMARQPEMMRAMQGVYEHETKVLLTKFGLPNAKVEVVPLAPGGAK